MNEKCINSGVWPTMLTLYDKNGKVDINANVKLAQRLVEMGSDGIFGICQSSEMFFLSIEEKVELAKAVKEVTDNRASFVISGHTADTLDEQISDLKKLAKVGADALVLVTNRLDMNNEGFEAFKKNTSKILEAIPDCDFGFYECPYPTRRLLSDDELKWSADTGRIKFLKDVSCDKEIETRRAALVKGTPLKLYNANTQTLLHSLRMGYNGYNGVMGNFHIDLYKWLYANVNDARAEKVQEWLSDKCTIEVPAYPMVAKYYLTLRGFDCSTYARSKANSLLDEKEKGRARELVDSENALRKELGLPERN